MKELLEKWFDALHSGDSMRISSLYADRASFLPTMSGDHKVGVNGAEEYFQGFLRRRPQGRILHLEIPFQSEDAVLHSGLYEFQIIGSHQPVRARFSFFWSKMRDGEWRITHHHSSVSP